MRNRKETISRFERNHLIREGKKYRYYFFDYLYYRLYVVYRKYNEPARFSACGVLCMVSVIVLFFFTYIIHSGFISGYQNRYGDNLKPPTNVYHRMTA